MSRTTSSTLYKTFHGKTKKQIAQQEISKGISGDVKPNALASEGTVKMIDLTTGR